MMEKINNNKEKEMRYLEIESVYDKFGNEIVDRRNEQQEISFEVNHNKGKSKCYLFEDQKENKIYILSVGACLKAVYTDADYKETERLASETPLNHGDIIRVKKRQGDYKVHVNGNYSDLGYLVAIK